VVVTNWDKNAEKCCRILMMIISCEGEIVYFKCNLGCSICSHAKVLEALTFCSEIRNYERFVPIVQGLSTGDIQMKVSSSYCQCIYCLCATVEQCCVPMSALPSHCLVNVCHSSFIDHMRYLCVS